MTKEQLQSLLTKHVCEVTFTKINGESRVMPCTLREDMLPVRSADESPRDLPANNLSVWCTDKQQWRSFRVPNVTGVRVLG